MAMIGNTRKPMVRKVNVKRAVKTNSRVAKARGSSVC